MSDLSLVRAALSHGVTGPLPVPNFACSLLGREARRAGPTPLATVTDLPAREPAGHPAGEPAAVLRHAG
jgi:hypothetical protein